MELQFPSINYLYLVLLNDVTQVHKALDEISRLSTDPDNDRDDV